MSESSLGSGAVPAAERRAVPLPDLRALTDPDALAALFGPVAEVHLAPFATSGFSGSRHERVTVRLRDGSSRALVLKHTRLDSDWLIAHSGIGAFREGLLLAEPALAGVWDAFACPYVAWAADDSEVGLLMVNLADHLLPDVREPIGEEQEHRLLGALAAMHARFWESAALDASWLARSEGLIGLLCPHSVVTQAQRGFPHPVVERAAAGWRAAFERLPARTAELLRAPPSVLAERARNLPRTLTHGDVKVANFGLLPDGRVAAFDWALVGAGPVANELGWHLAVNATRLPGSKEQTLVRYRGLLEGRLSRQLGDEFWRDTESAAALAGGAMLLWSKALALESGGRRARDEWDWWMERLAEL